MALFGLKRNSRGLSHIQNQAQFSSTRLNYQNDTVVANDVIADVDIDIDLDTAILSKLGLDNAPISLFGKGRAGASGDAANVLLGGKGANLAEMSHIGLSVPPGFTITTECCKQFCGEWDKKIPKELWKQVLKSLQTIEEAMDSEFGNPQNPLLLSVRSGAAISMPGMMDTVLNLGMNDDVVEGLAKKTRNARFAWDSYRRFLEMVSSFMGSSYESVILLYPKLIKPHLKPSIQFGNVVLEIPRSLFEEEIDDVKDQFGVKEDADLTTEQLMLVVDRFKGVYSKMDLSFPEDVTEQLELAVGAVFRGWMGDRAVKYREVENIRNLLGTAVNVQAMVFGNMGDTSGTGVCFTRDPNNGQKSLFGEFLINAQGEDVVAGIRTPKPISDLNEVMHGK